MSLTVPYFTDNFTRANSSAVAGANSTGGVGNGWIDRVGNIWSLSSNTALMSGGASPTADWLYRPTGENALNQRAVVTFTASTSADTVLLRVNSASNNAYQAYLSKSGGGLLIRSVVAGSAATIATAANFSGGASSTSYIIDFTATTTVAAQTVLTAVAYAASAPTTPLGFVTVTDVVASLQVAGGYGVAGSVVASGITNAALYAAPALTVTPKNTTVSVASSVVSITPTLFNSAAALTASVSGGGTLSTGAPTSGVAFTYTSPASGAGTATVTVSDTTDGISATSVITYAPASLTLSPVRSNSTGTPSAAVSLTATHAGAAGALTAVVSGGGGLSTGTPTTGVAFTYTAPATGAGTAIVTVTDATNGITASALIEYNATTTIANIHYGLSAWSSGAAVLAGARVSSNTYAWQALTSGVTGASAPLFANAKLSPSNIAYVSDGTVVWKMLSHIDSTTMQAWWNALPTLTTSVIANVWNNGVINISGAPELACSGGKTSSTFSATIRAAPGDSFVDLAQASNVACLPIGLNALTSGTTIRIASAKSFITVATAENIIISGLLFYFSSSGASVVSATDNSASTITLANCQCAGSYITTSTAASTTFALPSFVIYNCAFNMDVNSVISTGPASLLVENCSFENSVTFITSSNSSVILRNSLFFSCTTPLTYTGSGTISSSHNAYAVALGSLPITDTASVFTALRYTNNVLITSQYGNTGAGAEMRIQTWSICYRAGTTPTYATSDILGVIRTGGIDIGASQTVAWTNAAANIHYNLSIWSPLTPVTLATRVYCNGQAWQATSTGTTGWLAPSGTADVSDGSITWKWLSGYDYSDLDTWYAALPATLSQPVTAYIWNNGLINSGNQPILNIAQSTAKSNATNTITITPATGESFVDYHIANPSAPLMPNPASGVYITGNAGLGMVIVSTGDVLITNQLQLVNLAGFIGNGNYGAIKFTNCIMSADGGIDGGSYSGNNSTYTNVLGLITGPSSLTTFAFYSLGAAAITNCTFVALNAPTGLALTGNFSNPITFKNSIFIGFGTLYGGVTNVNITSSHNIFSNAAVGSVHILDTGSIFNATAAALFVSPTTDFRLQNACAAYDTGVTVPAVTTDIYGTLRPQYAGYDIGCYEIPFTAAAQWPIIAWLE